MTAAAGPAPGFEQAQQRAESLAAGLYVVGRLAHADGCREERATRIEKRRLWYS